MKHKEKLEDYTEREFLEFLNSFFENNSGAERDKLEEYLDNWLKQFEILVDHPKKSDIVFYPETGYEGTEGILRFVKEWLSANAKPGFKAE